MRSLCLCQTSVVSIDTLWTRHHNQSFTSCIHGIDTLGKVNIGYWTVHPHDGIKTAVKTFAAGFAHPTSYGPPHSLNSLRQPCICIHVYIYRLYFIFKKNLKIDLWLGYAMETISIFDVCRKNTGLLTINIIYPVRQAKGLVLVGTFYWGPSLRVWQFVFQKTWRKQWAFW